MDDKRGLGSHWNSLVAVGRRDSSTELRQEPCTNDTGNRHTLPPRHPVDGGAAPTLPASAAERECLARSALHQHVYGSGGSSCSRWSGHVVCVVGASPSVLADGCWLTGQITHRRVAAALGEWSWPLPPFWASSRAGIRPFGLSEGSGTGLFDEDAGISVPF